MKITIDTEKKTAIVHGEATFEEIIDTLKAICPKGWNDYKLTCENVTMASFSSWSDATTYKPNIFVTNTSGENIGWHEDLLQKNACRDLTYKP